MAVTLSEALRRYSASAKQPINERGHQELSRFGRAIGLERIVGSITPPLVADYAEGVVSAGGDVHGRLTHLKQFLVFLQKRGLTGEQNGKPISLSSHVKIPRSAVRAAVVAVAAGDPEAIELTADGHAAMTAELADRKNRREEVARAIQAARADGDVTENSPLDAAREVQGENEARIRELEETLRRAVIVGGSRDGNRSKVVGVGSRISLHDVESGRELAYTIVGSAEADPLSGKLSIDSPVGRAVQGKTQGDEVVVQAPKGKRRYRISAIEA
ncbi:MAG: transcription elongation factor GreA [Chloroflexota bacterium]|nr:transcription elongation factor GreA [Chloroflexota bacterium]